MSYMNWKAAMNSEVFREYAQMEIQKMALEQQSGKNNVEEDELNVLEGFKEFEKQVRSSPKKLSIFRALQNKFATDLDYAAKTKASFVEAVMMLDLS
jgi:hypothetical protein